MLFLKLLLSLSICSDGKLTCEPDEFLFQNKDCFKCEDFIVNCELCTSGAYSTIVNGSLEHPQIEGQESKHHNWQFLGSVPGWTSPTSDLIELNQENRNSVDHRKQFLPNSYPSNYYVSQDFVTEAGYDYEFSLLYAARADSLGSSQDPINVYWGDNFETYFPKGPGYPELDWIQYSSVITASSSTTQIKIEGTISSDSALGSFVDNFWYRNLPMCSKCLEGYFLDSKDCKQCPKNCSICQNKNSCSRCKETFVDNQGVCECPTDYKLDEITSLCIYKYLTYNFSVNEDTFDIEFSENLSEHLQSLFIPSQDAFDFTITPHSLSKHTMKAEYTPEDTEYISITFKSLEGDGGKSLKEDLYFKMTPLFKSYSYNNRNLQEENDLENSTENKSEHENKVKKKEVVKENEEVFLGMRADAASDASVATGVSCSLGLPILLVSPKPLWTFLNFSLIIYYMPLQNIDMPSVLKEFFKGFRLDLFGFMPAFISYIGIEDTAKTRDLFSSYEIKSSSFFINSLLVLLVLGIGITLFLLVLGLHCISKRCMKRFVSCLERILGKFKWNFFIRLIIIGFVDLMFGGLFSLKNAIKGESSLDVMFGTTVTILGFLLVPGLFFIIIIYRNKTREMKSMSTLFEEFKNEHSSQLLFYPLFFLRRLVYMFGIHFLEDIPFFQVLFNSLLSFVIGFYVIFWRPFKSPIESVINGVNECFLGILFVITGLCLIDLDRDHVIGIANFLSIGTLCVIGFNGLVFFVLAILKLRKRCRNEKKKQIISHVGSNLAKYLSEDMVILESSNCFSGRVHKIQTI